MKTTRPQKRSPLKDKPLRLPGQSVEEHRTEYLENNVLEPFLVASFLVVLALLEWYRYFFPFPPKPGLYSLIGAGGVLYAVFRIWRARPKLLQLRQARDGERAVAQYLDGLREKGYRVFHDVVGEGFNIDHVVIGPTGVFTVETKTYSKAPGPDAKVVVNGERIVVDGFEPDRDPIVQAKAQVAWLRELLRASTGRDFRVRPVIVFPGWWVDQDEASRRDIWVLNPKAFPSFLEKMSNALTPEDVTLASFHLSRFIRAKEAA